MRVYNVTVKEPKERYTNDVHLSFKAFHKLEKFLELLLEENSNPIKVEIEPTEVDVTVTEEEAEENDTF